MKKWRKEKSQFPEKERRYHFSTFSVFQKVLKHSVSLIESELPSNKMQSKKVEMLNTKRNA